MLNPETGGFGSYLRDGVRPCIGLSNSQAYPTRVLMLTPEMPKKSQSNSEAPNCMVQVSRGLSFIVRIFRCRRQLLVEAKTRILKFSPSAEDQINSLY